MHGLPDRSHAIYLGLDVGKEDHHPRSTAVSSVDRPC